MKVHSFAQRDGNFFVCKLQPFHRQLWLACYEHSIPLIGELEDNECVEFDLEASNITKLGKLYFEKSREEYVYKLKTGGNQK